MDLQKLLDFVRMAKWMSGDNEWVTELSIDRVCQLTLILVITKYWIGEWHSLQIIQFGPAEVQEWVTSVTKKKNISQGLVVSAGAYVEIILKALVPERKCLLESNYYTLTITNPLWKFVA